VYDETDPFTFNYSDRRDRITNQKCLGYWRGIYRDFYDTDRPHTHPWEMLGITKKPSWWESIYGPAPYTGTNLVLWEDLKNGVSTGGNIRSVLGARTTSIVNYENNTNYVNVYKSLDTEVQYYLRHGELLSHAYSIGSYLYYQYGTDSIKILSSLYNKGWNNNLHNVKVSYKVKWFLNKYNQMIRRAEQYNIVNDGKKLWNKLFKEIYRVILNKER
jgi:hypothetical protein